MPSAFMPLHWGQGMSRERRPRESWWDTLPVSRQCAHAYCCVMAGGYGLGWADATPAHLLRANGGPVNQVNEIQLALTQVLDEHAPIDVRSERDCRLNRLEHAARLAVRECRQAKLDQTSALALLLRIWKEP